MVGSVNPEQVLVGVYTLHIAQRLFLYNTTLSCSSIKRGASWSVLVVMKISGCLGKKPIPIVGN